MTTDEYSPSDQDMRWQYVVKRMHDGATRTHAEREYTRWLAAHDARVRREAEARIKAVENVLDAVDGDYDSHGAHRLGVTRRIRRALDLRATDGEDG